MRSGWFKKVGLGLVTVGVLTAFAGFLGVGYAGADPTWTADNNAVLKSAHKGATNPGFNPDDNGGCPTPPPGQEGWWGWHFVLQGNNTNFDTLDVNFQSYGFHAKVSFIASPSAKHAYVFTPTADTLLDAQAHVVADDPSKALDTEFNLSHVCAGTTSSSSSSSTSTSSSSSVSDSSDSTSSSSSVSDSSDSTSSSSTSESSSSVSDSSDSTSSSSTSESSSSVSDSSDSTSSSSSVLGSSESTSSSSSVLGSSESTSSSSSAAVPSSSSSNGPTVLGNEVSRAVPLARTGFDPTALLVLGLGFALAGGVLVFSADRLTGRRA